MNPASSWRLLRRPLFICLLVVVVLLSAAPRPCLAWGADGHRIVGRVAGYFLTPQAAAAVMELLGSRTLADVSTWADEIKSNSAYDWARPLHYANVPPGVKQFVVGDHCPKSGCVVSAVEDYTTVLRDATADRAARIEALKFLAHFVGDIHQPLHVSHARDRGGNDIKVRFFENNTNLHRVWDSGLIRRVKQPWKQYADRLHAGLTSQQLSSWSHSIVPSEWASETYALAVRFAYEIPKDGQLAEAYFKRSIPIVDQQLAMGGVRLAALLNAVFDDTRALPFAAKPAVAGTPPTDPLVLLSGVQVLTPDCGSVLKNRTIVMRGSRIERIVPSGGLRVPASATHLDGSGMTVIPGLIDLHTHLLLRPYDQATWDDQVLKESAELRTIRAVRAMRRTLQAGFTTVRDLGTEGAGFADLALRDAVAADIAVGPQIFAATRALVASGCYGPSGFEPQWDVPKGAQVADGVDGVRRAVREQIAAGADWIKVYADYRRRPGGNIAPTYSAAELAAVVDESTTAGVPVAAHATSDAGIRRAVMAGVQTIEHGTEASPEVLRLMHERGVVLIPTLAAAEAIARYDGWQPGSPDHPRIAQAKALIGKALAAEVTIACGSDAGVFDHGDNIRELELMSAYGMTPRQVLSAATRAAAEVLGRSADLGRIAPQYHADLVVLSANPLDDLTVLRRPEMVIQNGRVVAGRE